MMRASVFRLTPFLLLAAALLALAVFFAPGGQPAQAQTTTVWSATLTAQRISTTNGCSNFSGVASTYCSSTSVLTDDDFTYNGVNYEVTQLTVGDIGSLAAIFDKAIPTDLSLNVGDTAFSIASAALSQSDKAATWTNSGLSWSTGGTIQLSLTAPSTTTSTPKPTVSIFTNAVTVREGASVEVTARISESRSSATVVQLEMHAGTAESGDYGTLESITIPANMTTGTGAITTTMDSDTADEVFHVALKNVAKDADYAWGAVSWLDIRIEDSGLRQVSLSVFPNPEDEGTDMNVFVTLTSVRWGEEASLGSAVTIPLTLTAGSAEGGDYGSLASITISAGSKFGQGTISTTDDTDSDDETFTVALDTASSAWPSGVRPGPITSVQVRITDTDAASPGSLSVDTGFGNPECGSAMTASETPYTALVLSPAPSAEEPTEYRVLADTNGEWLAGVPVLTSGSSVFTSNNTFGGLRAAYPGFTGFEYRLADHPDVTASCTWTTGGI